MSPALRHTSVLWQASSTTVLPSSQAFSVWKM
jgi:hypothetical protein